MAVAITLAVIGEFVGSSEGWALLLSATSQLDTPLAFAALLALSLLGRLVTFGRQNRHGFGLAGILEPAPLILVLLGSRAQAF